jgi:streptogramin lyase
LNSVAELDATTGRVLADFGVGSSPDSIVFSGGRVWVVNDGDQTISVIDPKARQVEPPRGGIQSPCLLSPASDGGVWVSSCTGDLLSHVDPASLQVDRTFQVEAPGQAAELKGSLWVVSERSVAAAFGTNDVVERLDPASGRLLDTITVGAGAADLSIADGAIWGCDFYDNNLWRIDPRAGRAEFFPSDQAGRQFDRPLRVAAGPAGFWVNDAPHVTQLDFDPYRVTGVLDTYGVPVVSGLNFWVVDGTGAFVDRHQVSLVVSRRISRVDLATHDITVFDSPYATDAAAGDGVIWVSAGPIESPTSAQPRSTVAAEG